MNAGDLVSIVGFDDNNLGIGIYLCDAWTDPFSGRSTTVFFKGEIHHFDNQWTIEVVNEAR